MCTYNSHTHYTQGVIMRARALVQAWLAGIFVLFLTLGGCLSRKPTIDEFRRTVMDKTEQEVKMAVGNPKKIVSKLNTEGKIYWYYVYKAVDSKTGNNIPQTTVVFKEGKVVEVKVE